MASTIITVSSGSFSAQAELEVSGGAAPEDVLPTVTAINGNTIITHVGESPAYGSVLYFSPFMSQSAIVNPPAGTSYQLSITGTNLDRVDSIQLDMAAMFTQFAEPVDETVPAMTSHTPRDSFNSQSFTGSAITPDGLGYKSWPFTLIDPQHIVISSADIQYITDGYTNDGWNTWNNNGSPSFRFPQSNAFEMGWESSVQNGVWARNTVVGDMWWKLRLWTGTLCVQPEFFIQMLGPRKMVIDPPDLYPTTNDIGSTFQFDGYFLLSDNNARYRISRNPNMLNVDWATTDINDNFDTSVISTDQNGLVTIKGEGQAKLQLYFSNWTRVSATVIVEPPPPPSAVTVFSIAGNPSYTDGVSALTYLEAYPMWSGTQNPGIYMSASTATPNPPKTGHAAVRYNTSTGVVTVLSSGTGTAASPGWQGTYNKSPWQERIYAMSPAGDQYLVKGYAGQQFSGAFSDDGTYWRYVSATSEVNAFLADATPGLPALSASTNYYAMTVLGDSMTAGGLGLDFEGLTVIGDRVLYFVSWGPDFTGSFADLQSIYLFNDFAEVAAESLNFKKLNDSEVLAWLPDVGGNKWPATYGNDRLINFRFSGSTVGEWTETGLQFYPFTGV